jgi:hypothetical protein
LRASRRIRNANSQLFFTESGQGGLYLVCPREKGTCTRYGGSPGESSSGVGSSASQLNPVRGSLTVRMSRCTDGRLKLTVSSME